MTERNDTITEGMAQRGYLPAVDAATLCGCAVSTIYRLIDRSAVEGFRAGESGMWFVRRSSLAAHYGPQVSEVLKLNVLLPGEDPKAKALPAQAPSSPARAPGKAKGSSARPAPSPARKAPRRAR